jgi:hypothetical protein
LPDNGERFVKGQGARWRREMVGHVVAFHR